MRRAPPRSSPRSRCVVAKPDKRTKRALAERDAAAAPKGDTMVAWVHSEWVAHSWFQSILALVMTSPRVGPYTAMKCGTDGLVAARNQTVQAFLSSQIGRAHV